MVGLTLGHYQSLKNLIFKTSNLSFVITIQIVPYVLDNVLRVLYKLFQWP